MKIAAVTDDEKTISPHFGQARHYVVFTIENGRILAREFRGKANHRDFQQEGFEGGLRHRDEPHGRGDGQHLKEKNQRMFTAIQDCQVLLARGIGKGAYHGLKQMEIQPIITNIPEIKQAVRAVIDGNIDDHPNQYF